MYLFKGSLLTILWVVFILNNKATAGPHDKELDLDGDMDPDVRVHFNEENSMVILKNEVYRKGINKYTETIDLSDIKKVKKQLEMDRSETDSLKQLENVQKQDLEYQCPNFQITGEYIDDINNVSMEDVGAVPLRIFHGEHPPRAGELDFIVTMKTINNKEVCEFEYSEHQRQILQSNRGSMVHLTTHEECAKQGILVLDSKEDMVINMTFTNLDDDRQIGLSSCSRACHSYSVQHEFHLKNSFLDEQCLQEETCFQPRPCKYWSFIYEDNLCYIHGHVGPEDSVLNYYMKEITGLHGQSGCVSNNDQKDPYILSGSKFVGVAQVCNYIPNGQSDLRKKIKSNCQKDFMYRNEIQMKEEGKIRNIEMFLENATEKHRKKRFANILLGVASQIPAITQWVQNIMSSTASSTKVISTSAPKSLFDLLTLDKRYMFRGLLSSLGHRYSAQFLKTPHERAEKLQIPQNWKTKENHFNIQLLKTDKGFMSKMIRNKIEQNIAWNLRRKENQRETEKLILLTKAATKTGQPLTELMVKKLSGKSFVFASQTILEGPKIQRMFMIVKDIQDYPDIQYLAVGMKARSNITEGHVVIGRYQSPNHQTLSCLTSLQSDQKLDNDCIIPRENEKKISEFKFFSKGTTAIIVKLTIPQKPVEFLCPDKADVVFSLGVLIVALSDSCTIKADGATLRAGEESRESDVKGIHMIYNGKKEDEVSVLKQMIAGFKQVDKDIEELKIHQDVTMKLHNVNDKQLSNSTEEVVWEKLSTLKKQLEALKESGYAYGPHVDLFMTALLGCAAVSTIFYKIYSSCSELRE